MKKTKKYDVVIIGAGASGLTAAIYALRSGQSVAIIEKGMIGGQASLTYEVKNFPGFKTISGMELSLKMHEQATELGAETFYGEVTDIDFEKMNNVVHLANEDIVASAIILCMGAKARTLNAEGEAEFTGKGVAYCAVCDGAFYKDKRVAVIGGGNTAIEDAIYLSNICKSVLISNNLPSFTCQQTLLDELNKTMLENKNIKIQQNTIVESIYGKNCVEGVKFTNDSDEKTNVKLDGVFVAIGRAPDTKFVRNKIHLDEKGYIAVNDKLETNQPGVFAAGDVIVKDLRQIITACADGAIAATNANSFINSNK